MTVFEFGTKAVKGADCSLENLQQQLVAAHKQGLPHTHVIINVFNVANAEQPKGMLVVELRCHCGDVAGLVVNLQVAQPQRRTTRSKSRAQAKEENQKEKKLGDFKCVPKEVLQKLKDQGNKTTNITT